MRGPAERSRKEELVVATLVLAVMGLAALNAGRFFFRLDLSSNGASSISRASKKIARELPEKASITYYVSDKLAGRYAFPQQIRDMLGEYAGFSEGKISLAVEDPAREGAAFKPERLGITARQMQVIERQEMNLATVYSGVVIRYLDRLEAIPFVSDTSDLEYGVSSRIRSLVQDRRRTIGILLGDGRKDLRRDYGSLLGELGPKFRVEQLQRGKEIPSDVDVLFLIGNTDLEERDLIPVDRYIMGGGRALFAVSGVEVDMDGDLSAKKVGETAVFDMLAAYGARVERALVLDRGLRISFRSRDDRIMSVDYPHWITVSKKYAASDSPVTSRFAGLDLYWPSPLEIVDRQGVEAKAILSTTGDAWVMRDNFQTDPVVCQSPAVRDAAPRGRFTLVLSLSGTFRSFFAGGERSPMTRLIVVGDSDFASDMIKYTQAAYNMAFLSNCAEWLDMQDDLLEIKTRTQTDLRLNAIEDPWARSRVVLMSQIVNVAIVPLLVIAFGFIRLTVRRRRESKT